MKIIKLTGNLHRKQFDLVNLSGRYDAVRFVLPDYKGKFDFRLATELGSIGDFEASNFLKNLDDKLVFKKFCDETGLKTLPWSSGSVREPGEYLFKPRVSAGSIGITIKKCEVNELIPSDYIAESRLRDFQTYGIGYYAFEGSIRNKVTWKRIKTFPRNGGPSSVAEVIEYPRLDRLGDMFLEKVAPSDIHGFFMLEFIFSDDELFFLEINPRVWGSIALLELSAGDFISNFVWDNLRQKVHHSGYLGEKVEVFVNPLFEPLMLFKRRRKFYSGFSYGGLRGFRYVFSMLNFRSFKKLLSKVF